MDSRTAEVVLPCPDLEPTLLFFIDRLGFRVAEVVPADDPAEVVVEGHGLRVRLRRGAAGGPGVLRVLCADPLAFAGGTTELVAPNGTRVEIAASDPPIHLPPVRPSFSLAIRERAEWRVGRAGMRYRDLIPDRQGGRFVASHIVIPEGGAVADYVHFHRVRFQMIFCSEGWVRVVYEDQGPPFVLRTGDCVLQPPRIRHRVLESAAGAEVIELACPAAHETIADPATELPTKTTKPDRLFDGQRFVRSDLVSAAWRPWRCEGFEARDLGMDAATEGLATASVVRGRDGSGFVQPGHDAELRFTFVLKGSARLRCEGRRPDPLRAGDAFVIPPGWSYGLEECRGGLEFLEVTLPGRPTRASVSSA
jgi:quercetin dioxygenase-like cupin family protein